MGKAGDTHLHLMSNRHKKTTTCVVVVTIMFIGI